MSDHAQEADNVGGASSSSPSPTASSCFPRYASHNGGEIDTHLAATIASSSSQQQHYALVRRSTQARIETPVKSSAYLCGLLAGVAQAGIFNPYDRALYLSVKENRSFLSWQNWQSPYSGFFQSIGGRALSGGLYFPLEHYFLHLIRPQYASSLSSSLDDAGTMSASYSKQHFVAGTLAGAANAIVLNPLSAIKYKSWGRQVSRGMWSEAVGMLHKAGSLRPFWNGLWPTLYRDVTFGGCYTLLRFRFQRMGGLEQWQANILAAAFATVVSGPFNYVRNIQYGTKSQERALSTFSILNDLSIEASQHETLSSRLRLLTTRLRVGWGTCRVALGMSLGHTVYDILQDQLSKTRVLF